MKTPVRFQSQLLVRRSYRPERIRRRTLPVTFRPADRFVLSITDPLRPDATSNAGERVEIALTG